MTYIAPSLTTSGANFAAFQAGGLSGVLETLITVNLAGTSPPTVAATLSATAGGTVGGLLPPGVYYATFTETNGVGETVVSAESGPVTVAVQAAPTGTPTVSVTGSGGTLTAGAYKGVFTYVDTNLNAAGAHGETTAGNEFSFTQVGTDEPVITINDGGLPAWASGRNLYLTAVSGATGTEVLAFTGITATTYTITANPTASTVVPPAANTTSTNIPKITAFPALQTGNTARNIYLTAAGGASGSETLWATGVTTTTYTFSTAPATNSLAGNVPPTASRTGLTYLDNSGNTINKSLAMLRGAKNFNLETAYRFAAQVERDFNRGDAFSFSSYMQQLRHAHTVFAAINQALTDIGTLMDANPGTIRPTTAGGVGTVSTSRRSWP